MPVIRGGQWAVVAPYLMSPFCLVDTLVLVGRSFWIHCIFVNDDHRVVYLICMCRYFNAVSKHVLKINIGVTMAVNYLYESVSCTT